MEFRDSVFSTVRFRLSWWDWLKLIAGGATHVRVVVRTENVVGRTNTEPSEVWVAPPRWWPRSKGAATSEAHDCLAQLRCLYVDYTEGRIDAETFERERARLVARKAALSSPE